MLSPRFCSKTPRFGRNFSLLALTSLFCASLLYPQPNSVPAGTILPVVLRTSISLENSKPGQILKGKVAQDVPLPGGSMIRKGTTVEGHIVEVSPATTGEGTRVTLQFDKLNLKGRWIPLKTNLRAIAGYMAVMQAGVPEQGPGESSPVEWMATTQIGGDTVYGLFGPVTSAERTTEVIGRSVGDGVLVRVSSKEGTPCRGAFDKNDQPQALWVFSSDACGVYGIEHLKIARADTSVPEGAIVLVSETHTLKLRSGDGLLLRVD